jgi:heme-degrading monooxygenase HmoA
MVCETFKTIEEGIMAVSVIIRRTFKDTETAARLAPLIVKLRSLAAVQKGYITGRTFRCLDCPGEYLVISTWNSLDDWNRWQQSPERQTLQERVDALLGEKTEYRLYEPLVGGIVPKF